MNYVRYIDDILFKYVYLRIIRRSIAMIRNIIHEPMLYMLDEMFVQNRGNHHF